MRIWPVLGVVLLTTGCLESSHVSLQPLFDDKSLVELPSVVGTWVGGGDPPTVLTFAPADGGLYTMSPKAADGETRTDVIVAFGRIGDGDRLYWDITALADKEESALRAQHRLSVHSFARILLDGDRLEIAPLQNKWLKAALAESRVEIAHAEVEGEIVLTASPAELRRFLREHGDDEGAFGETQVYRRKLDSE